MGYLPIIDENQATGELKETYEEIKKKRKLKRPSPILQAFSMKPGVLQAVLRLTDQVTITNFGGSAVGSLGRRWDQIHHRQQQEMLSTAVSSWNHCHY